MPTPSDYYDPGAGNWRNFNPPPTTPGVFNPADPYGRRPDPSRTTESSTRDGNPQATQTAQAPPPTPADTITTLQSYTPEEIAGAKARGMIGQNGLPLFPPGSVKFNSQGVPYNPNEVGPGRGVVPPEHPFPTPDQAAPPPEPAAKPLPNLGHWTPDQAKPWMHVKPIAPQQVPDRPPDTHVGTRPAYHPRPTEAGYTPPVHQPGQPYSFAEQLGFALQAGFTGQAAYTAAALGMAESKGNAGIVHYNDGGKGYNSYGLLQINGVNDPVLRAAGINGASAAVDPLTSYKAGYIISKGGTDFSAWSTYNDGSYKQFLDPNAQPAASSTLAVGPRQDYRPPPGREPQEWGRTPEHDWSPGNMPTAHDIPGILGALLPIAIAGVLGGGGLGMIAAYAGYQNARNKGQLEEAKEQRTRWRDQLAETEAGLKEELLESSGLMAEFGNDFTSPAAQQAWSELAAKYQDPQLRAALESGNPAAVEQLFKKRDEAFQSINKVSAADTKAAQQEQEKQSNEAAERSTVNPDDGGGGTGGGAPGATPAAARGPERPWENLGPGFAGGGPGAGVAPPAAGGRPAPAATPAEQPAPDQPPAEQPEAPAPAAPQPAAAPGGEQPAAPSGGAPATGPQELPDVGVSGLAPANLPARLAPQVTGLTPDRLDQDARQYLETQKDPYKGGPSGDPLAIVRNEAVRVRASQMQSYIDKVIRDTKPGDIEGALQKLDTVDPGMAAIARSVDRGDQPQPTGWQLRVPLYQTVNKLVTSLDPTFSATRYITNWRTKVAYSTGTQSIQVASINRALQHMTVLMDAAKHLGNTDYPSWNALVNAVQTQLGSDAATNFTAARSAVSRELERAFRGGSGAYAEIKQDLENVGTSGSPAQILGLIRTDTELLRGQLDALADLYGRGTHTKTTGDDLLTPQARDTYRRIMQMPLDRPPPETTTVNGKAVPVGPDRQELDPTIPYPSAGPGPAPAELPPGVTVTEEP